MTPEEYKKRLNAIQAAPTGAETTTQGLTEAETKAPTVPLAQRLLRAGSGIGGAIGAGGLDILGGAATAGADVLESLNILPPGSGSRQAEVAKEERQRLRSATGASDYPVVEALSSMAPYMLAPELRGGAVAQMIRGGLVGGGTTFLSPIEGEGLQDRMRNRLILSGIGTAVGAGSAGLGAKGTQASGAREIQAGLKRVQDLSSMDPLLAPQRQAIVAGVNKMRKTFIDKSRRAMQLADDAGEPIDAQGKMDIVSAIGQGAAKSDAKSLALAKDIESQLLPPVRLGNIQFGPSSVVGNRYSALKEMSKRLEARLEGTEPNATGRTMLEMLAAKIDTSLDAFERANPLVSKAMKATQSYYDKSLGKFDNPVVQDILRTPDDIEMGKKALATVLSGRPQDRKVMLEVFGEPLKKHVEIAAAKTALASSVDANSGVLDPVAMVRWFKDNPQLDKFLGPDMRKELDGIANLMTDSAMRKGFVAPSKAMKALESPYVARAGAWAAGLSALKESPTGIAAGVGAMFIPAAAQAVERILNSPFGKAMAAAAADVRPGTPKMGRIANLLFSRFGPAATGNELVDQFGLKPEQ